MCAFFDTLDKLELTPRLSMVKTTSNKILENYHSGPGQPPRASKMWPLHFCCRKPQHFKQRQKTIHIDRTLAHYLEDIEDWFQQLQRIIRKYNIKPSDLWNMDETGFIMGIGQDNSVLTQDSERTPFTPSTTNQQSVTIVEAASAGRAISPSLAILPIQVHQES